MTTTPITIYLITYVGHWKKSHLKKCYTKKAFDAFIEYLNANQFFYQIVEVPTRLTLLVNS